MRVQGTNILLAQYLFLGLYLAFIAVLMFIYHEAKLVSERAQRRSARKRERGGVRHRQGKRKGSAPTQRAASHSLCFCLRVLVLMRLYVQCPPWVFLLLCCSRRIHSIFMLRCFNDCFALFFLYCAILLLLKHRWTLGCVLVSLALSIKMNILLFMPALGVLLLQRFGVWRTLARLLLMLLVQLVLAVPFLLVQPWNYLRLAFDFSRSFFYVWSVNLKVLSEEVFLSPGLARGLLVAHLLVLAVLLHRMLEGGLPKFAADMIRNALLLTPSPPLQTSSTASASASSSSRDSASLAATTPSAGYIVTLMFVSNFVGIVFAKSLHYQFYVWYYHTLPLLLYLAPLPNWVRLLALALIEYSWNVFPATPASSAILIACHLLLLTGLLFTSRFPKPPTTTPVVVAVTGKKVQ